MDIGLIAGAFLVFLFLLALRRNAASTLDQNKPLGDDDLPYPDLGYGSSVLSLSALFGAYTAALFLLGVPCFVGALAGVSVGIFVLARAMRPDNSPRKAEERDTSFQGHLYRLKVFREDGLDRVFWILLGFTLGLFAQAEMHLFRFILTSGMNFSLSQAIAGVLIVGLVGYLYCLMAGYKAVFRTDAFQYLAMLLMGAAALWLFIRLDLPLRGAFEEQPLRLQQALGSTQLGESYLRQAFWPRKMVEVVVGFGLGVMPTIGAPDHWKRIFMISTSRRSTLRLTALPLIAALPVLLAVPALTLLPGTEESTLFPLQGLFNTTDPTIETLLVLGVIAAFLATFDSTLVSITHLLLKIRMSPVALTTERQRYHCVLGLVFVAEVMAFLGTSHERDPYLFGLIALGFTAVTVGLFSGTLGGRRTIHEKELSMIILVLASLAVWAYLIKGYVAGSTVVGTPALMMLPTGAGVAIYFLITALSYHWSSDREGATDG